MRLSRKLIVVMGILVVLLATGCTSSSVGGVWDDARWDQARWG